MTYRVNEIFYSLQGEGIYTGTPAIFLRLSGCNLRCGFCDTQHTSATAMTIDDIHAALRAYPAHHLVITGGEPCLQLDEPLLAALKSAGYYIQIETNGTIALEPRVLDLIDWVTCSPKFGLKDVSGDAVVKIGRIDEIKVVYSGQTLAPYEALCARYPHAFRCLQPCDVGDREKNDRIIMQTIKAALSNPAWRLSLQTHKLLNIQ